MEPGRSWHCTAFKIHMWFNYSDVSDSCNPMAYIAHRAPLSTGILQARILEWVAMPSPMGPSPAQALNSGP